MAGALREVLARFGFQVDDKKLDKADGKVNSLVGSMKSAVAFFAAGQVLSFAKGFVSELQAAGDQLTDTSNQLGVGAQDLQRWQLAAKLSGAEASDLATGVKLLSKNAADAKNAGDFKKLGVQVKDSAGNMKDPLQLMGDVGLEIAKMKDPAMRTAAALKFFGKAGTKLVPMFKDGEEGLQGALDRLDELGGGLGDDALDILEKSGDATDELGIAMLSLKSRLAVNLFPALSTGIGWLTKLIAEFSSGAKNSKILESTVAVLGASAAIAGLTALAPWLPFMLLIGGAIFLVDDLWTAWEGGDSVIAKVVDSIFGVGTTKEVIADLKQAWEFLNNTIGKTPGTANKANVALKAMGAGVGAAWDETIGGALRDIQVMAGSMETHEWFALGTDMITRLFAGFSSVDIINETVMKFRELVNRVQKFATEMLEKGRAIGKSVVEGIMEGLESMATSPVEFIKGMGTKMLNALKTALKSHSPSEAAKDITYSVPQGGVIGLEKGERMLLQAATRLGGLTLEGFNQTQGAAITGPGGQASRGGGAVYHTTYNVEQRNDYRFSSAGAGSSPEQLLRTAARDQSDMAKDSLMADLEALMPEPV